MPCSPARRGAALAQIAHLVPRTEFVRRCIVLVAVVSGLDLVLSAHILDDAAPVTMPYVYGEIAVAFVAVLAACVLFGPVGPLCWRPVQWLGRRSYAVYLWQGLFAAWFVSRGGLRVGVRRHRHAGRRRALVASRRITVAESAQGHRQTGTGFASSNRPGREVIRLRLTTAGATMATMISASGVRIGWSELPVRVQDAVGQILGSPVVEAHTQAGGFSPGSADRVVTANGQRGFVKAAGAEQNDRTAELHRREAAVAAALPAGLPVPALLGVHDDGRWVALVFDDVGGRHPVTPWAAGELDAVVTALAAVAAVPVAAGSLPSSADELADDVAGWHRIAKERPRDLDPWALDRLDELRAEADRAVPALRGDHLVHTDVRADNLLIRPDGSVAVVDWPWAARGPVWLDRLLLLVNVNLFSGHDIERLITRYLGDVEPADVTAVLVGLAGYFLDAGRQPDPPGLPTVRAFQAAQGARTLDWVRARWVSS